MSFFYDFYLEPEKKYNQVPKTVPSFPIFIGWNITPII